MGRTRGLGALVGTLLMLGCGGGAASSASTGGGSPGTSGGEGTASASAGGGDGGAGSFTGGERRSGLSVHIQNLNVSGDLPEEPSSRFDRLTVTFELDLNHTGTEPINGINVVRARLVHDDGREIVFGVMSEGWDGRLDAGQHRTVAFHKTPDSASPPPSRTYCGVPMRLEVTLELAGRQARATSRRVIIQCPPSGS